MLNMTLAASLFLALFSLAEPPAGTGTPAAIVDGTAVQATDLYPLLAEAAGGAVLQEVILDLRLDKEMSARSLKVSLDDVEREKTLLGTMLGGRPGAAPDEVSTIIEEVRRARGLGEKRFTALLRRNAAMRKIVQPEVQMSETMITQAYSIRYGQRYKVRIIVTPTQDRATAAREEVIRAAGGPGAPVTAGVFGTVASRLSIDESAARGGQVEELSVDDPAYPKVVQQAVPTLNLGQVSGVLALDQGFGIVYLEDKLSPTGVPIDRVRADLERDVRVRQERILMEQLAQRLMSQAGVTIMDRGLDWSWRASRSGLAGRGAGPGNP